MRRAMSEKIIRISIIDLVFGAYEEGSAGVHNLLSLQLRGKVQSQYQMVTEVSAIKRKLSLAAVRANNTVLLARLGQVGEGKILCSASSNLMYHRQTNKHCLYVRLWLHRKSQVTPF